MDGEWEHSYGVEIGTLDNPGWRVKVDLEATELKSRRFQRHEVHRSEDDWCVTWVDDAPSTRPVVRPISAKPCTGSVRGRHHRSDWRRRRAARRPARTPSTDHEGRWVGERGSFLARWRWRLAAGNLCK